MTAGATTGPAAPGEDPSARANGLGAGTSAIGGKDAWPGSLRTTVAADDDAETSEAAGAGASHLLHNPVAIAATEAAPNTVHTMAAVVWPPALEWWVCVTAGIAEPTPNIGVAGISGRDIGPGITPGDMRPTNSPESLLCRPMCVTFFGLNNASRRVVHVTLLGETSHGYYCPELFSSRRLRR